MKRGGQSLEKRGVAFCHRRSSHRSGRVATAPPSGCQDNDAAVEKPPEAAQTIEAGSPAMLMTARDFGQRVSPRPDQMLCGLARAPANP
jgi:hypothetical protein